MKKEKNQTERRERVVGAVERSACWNGICCAVVASADYSWQPACQFTLTFRGFVFVEDFV